MMPGMGVLDDGLAYTDKDEVKLIVVFDSPFNQYMDFKTENFVVKGLDGAYIKSVEAALPNNPTNVAYTVTVHHDFSVDEKTKVEVP